MLKYQEPINFFSSTLLSEECSYLLISLSHPHCRNVFFFTLIYTSSTATRLDWQATKTNLPSFPEPRSAEQACDSFHHQTSDLQHSKYSTLYNMWQL